MRKARKILHDPSGVSGSLYDATVDMYKRRIETLKEIVEDRDKIISELKKELRYFKCKAICR